MKIAITAIGEKLSSEIDTRFGRCQYLLIVDHDTMEFTINISSDRTQSILFMTDGCGPSIACGSMTTRLSIGKTIEEALRIEDMDILKALDGLPNENKHSAKLSADTLHEPLNMFLKGSDD